MADEPSLPRLPAISWNEHTQSFSNNPRKRGRARRSSNATPLFNNSSDPAVFSSDDDPALDNYVEGRRKKRYVGTWFQQQPASDSSFEVEESRPLPKPKRTLKRQLDSGVWMGSDSTDGEEMLEELSLPLQPKLPQLNRTPIQRPTLSAAERLAREKIQKCLDEGDEDVDLSMMGLESLSNATIAPLAELVPIPLVAEDVPFEQKDPSLKLFLFGNPLLLVPGAIFDLQHLTVLSLRGCGLRELPAAVAKLSQLETLNLAQNSLRHLPADLLNLLAAPGKLKNMQLQGNDFYRPRGLPQDIPDGASIRHPAYEPDNEAKNEFEKQEDRLITRLPAQFEGVCAMYLARSAVQFSDTSGFIYSDFRLDEHDEGIIQIDESEVDTISACPPSSAPYQSKSTGRSIDTSKATRVPSLLELAARSCYRSSDLEELKHYLPESPSHMRDLLDRAVMQRSIGGYECTRCKRTLVMPSTQWLEWWRVSQVRALSTPTLEGQGATFVPWCSDPDEQGVPFLRMGCSWKCVPEERRIGAWALRDDQIE
ncbi:hypothetical protein D7B24_001769 [Verticillium nonalfalfae]|uniref:Uncharacterized protein n=1 Tax=Verticillium nonalfalfae TaxID=1051616 RepID=A0A3M9Y2W2_9PEZI|nr:uncharacterized protein D7B24_001769 [Verticillium nonalfalfae]RNJ53480.1 hypothetical protein D7B24_001769 [Verticillium nonalfalfae]